jgi:prevent-host-death family protein
MLALMSIPYVDPALGYITVSELRNAIATDRAYIVTKEGKPVAVYMPYAMYLELQALLELPKANAASGGKP